MLSHQDQVNIDSDCRGCCNLPDLTSGGARTTAAAACTDEIGFESDNDDGEDRAAAGALLAATTRAVAGAAAPSSAFTRVLSSWDIPPSCASTLKWPLTWTERI